MGTAIAPAAARLVVAPAATTTEATIEQLLSARLKLERRAASLKDEAQQRSARDARDFAEQAAQLVDSAPEPLDTRVVDTLAGRLKTLADNDEKSSAGLVALKKTWDTIQARLDELKKSAAERALLIRVLERQRERLRQERAGREDQAQDLTEIIDRIEHDLDELSGGGGGATAKAAPPKRRS